MTPETQTTILTFTFCTLAVIGACILIATPLLFIWHNLINKPTPKPQICTRNHKCAVDEPCNGFPRDFTL